MPFRVNFACMIRNLSVLSAFIVTTWLNLTGSDTSRLVKSPAEAQPVLAFQENRAYVSLAYGFGNFLRSTFEAGGVDQRNQVRSSAGPLMAKAEYALSPNLGFGMHLAMMSLKNEWNDTAAHNSGTGTYTGWSALARVNYHLKPGQFFDPYIGFGVGYRRDRIRETKSNPAAENKFEEDILLIPFNLGMDLTIGFRMMVTPQLGMMMETGIAKGIVQLGIVFSP